MVFATIMIRWLAIKNWFQNDPELHLLFARLFIESMLFVFAIPLLIFMGLTIDEFNRFPVIYWGSCFYLWYVQSFNIAKIYEKITDIIIGNG